ncbi:MAG TPA: glycosyltransferase [Ignavibacteria bacterium]|nr:glycosyltransferase [Ignavibacteria bacterium]
MRVSGFTIIRNGIMYVYPFKEAILSILPLCDEMIINVGKSKDGTLEAVKSIAETINDKKIKIFESEWDDKLKDGLVLSEETNKALKKCSGDWCFYIQSDEVLHEKYYPVVRNAMEKYLNEEKVEGLRFRYKHFYGSYDYYQDNYRKWYPKESRVIRRRDDIVSWGDAMDFRHKDGSKLFVKDINAEIYHYGWVRPPEKLIKKRIDFELLYNDSEKIQEKISKLQNYDEIGNLKKFNEPHPEVMKERIAESRWNFDAQLDKQKPDWIRKILIFFHPVTKRLKKIFN